MATAPDWTEDEKKRRSLQRRFDTERRRFEEGGLLGGTIPGALEDARETFLPSGRLPIALSDQSILRGRAAGTRAAVSSAMADPDRVAQVSTRVAGAATPTEIPRGDARNQFNNVFDGRSDLSTTNLRGAGLQRVVKTADGTYTDNPNATGDVRYYNQFGNRADTGDVEYNPAGLSGPEAVAARLAAENAAQLDLSNPANTRLVLERGREAQRQMSGRQAQLAERQQMEFLAGLDPSDRAEMLTEQAKTNALARNNAATNAITLRGQDLTAGTAAAARRSSDAEQLLAQDNYERELIRENPQAAVRELLGGLSGLSDADRVRALSDPKNPKTSRIRDAVRAAAVGAGADPNFRPGASRRATGLERFIDNPITGLLGGGGSFSDQTGPFGGNLFNPQDFGLTDAEWEAIMRADRQPRN